MCACLKMKKTDQILALLGPRPEGNLIRVAIVLYAIIIPK